MRLARSFLFLFWFAFALPGCGQTWTFGTPADPCLGGTPFTIPSTGATVRYGDFTCTLPVALDTGYQVRLNFLEPCQKAGDCSVMVTGKGQRVENAFVQDQPVLWQYDIFTAGFASSRAVLAWSVNQKVIVKVQTLASRWAVLAGVTIGPVSATSFITQGTGPSRLYLSAGTAPADTLSAGVTYDGVLFLDPDGALKLKRKDGTITPALIAVERLCANYPNCSGLELLTIGGRALVAVPATSEALAIPQCPGANPCWQ